MAFEIQHAPNPQSDRIWAESRDHSPVHTVKQPAELMVWRAMSAESLTEVHIVSKSQTVNIESYVPQILEGSFFPTLTRSAEIWPVIEKKMVNIRSKATLMKDKAPSYTSQRTHDWCA